MPTVEEGVNDALRYIVGAESLAVHDVIAGANKGLSGEKVQFHNKGPADNGVGGPLWALQAPFLRSCKRIMDNVERELSMRWLAKNVNDTCAVYWRCRELRLAYEADPKNNPNYPRLPDEAMQFIDGELVNPASDELRHDGVHGLIHCAMDPEMVAYGVDVQAVMAVALDWGDVLQDYSWHRMKREQHRMGIPLADLAALYEFTGNEKWKALASSLLNLGWGADTGRTIEGDGFDFMAWDSGYPWEERGFVAGDVTDYPWYQGDMGLAFLAFFMHANGADQGLMRDRVMRISDWYVERDRCAVLKPKTDDLQFMRVRNTPFHGWQPGDFMDGWHRGRLPHVHDLAHTWATMGDDVAYWPARCLYYHFTDGLYWDTDHAAAGHPEVERLRHGGQMNPVPAWDWKNISDLIYDRYLLTGNPRDRLLAIGLMYDYKAFADWQGAMPRKKSQANPLWWKGAWGTARGMGWRFCAGWRTLDLELGTDREAIKARLY